MCSSDLDPGPGTVDHVVWSLDSSTSVTVVARSGNTVVPQLPYVRAWPVVGKNSRSVTLSIQRDAASTHRSMRDRATGRQRSAELVNGDVAACNTGGEAQAFTQDQL